jgi:hypothetical protein
MTIDEFVDKKYWKEMKSNEYRKSIPCSDI